VEEDMKERGKIEREERRTIEVERKHTFQENRGSK